MRPKSRSIRRCSSAPACTRTCCRSSAGLHRDRHGQGCAARLADVEIPSYPDVEQTFDELHARIQKTIDYLKSFDGAQIDGSEARQIVLKMRVGPIEFTGQSYLLNFVLPNFFFHVTTAYDILRHSGVELGKLDYWGARPARVTRGRAKPGPPLSARACSHCAAAPPGLPRRPAAALSGARRSRAVHASRNVVRLA